MELKLYNTLTKAKETFTPIDASNVRMYVCGPTVYDFAHIGNARPVIVFDVLYRLLRHVYGADHVTYVRNITDVDDKINDRAARDYPDLPLNDAIRKVTEQTEKQFKDDVAALGCLEPTVQPRATEHIAQMRDLIQKLVERNHAYVEQDHVLFSVPSMPAYGKLARRSLDEMMAGARVDVAPYKRNPMDFVLWKPSKPGEPAWPSPCAIAPLGRPGWHIECSAMSWKHLGERFDIHGGGIDLVFPHHENEIAQSCCAFGSERMANVWMHNGFLQVEGQKMSKSLGNFITINELLNQGWDGRVIRLLMLKSHYRQPIDWTRDGLMRAGMELHKFARLTSDECYDNSIQNARFVHALSDDLNTPQAIAELHALLSSIQQRGPQGTTVADQRLDRAYAEFSNALHVLGFGGLQNFDFNSMIARLHYGSGGPDVSKISVHIEQRAEARARKDWKESDRIRDELATMGIVLKDGKDENGNPVTTWEVAR